MENKTFFTLEYNRIIEMLKAQAGSELTCSVISELTPFNDAHSIRDKQMETTESVRLIDHKGPLPVGGFYDIGEIVSLAEKGGTLTMAQLLKVMYNIRVAGRIKAFVAGDVPDIPVIMSMAELLNANTHLSDEIDRCILSEDEMADNASPELRSIRRSITRQNEALRSRLARILTSSDNASALQDSIVTIRNGRYVIPVKQEHRMKVPGIVHDQSGSGATLFIEPQAIVEMNNELRQLELDEEKEINRILQELSGTVAECKYDLRNDQDMMVKLDMLTAKGKLSVMMRGEEPQISDAGIMDIKAARHPLLDSGKAVPVDIKLGDGYGVLVITGPNTGGKTVTMKTAGLLALMAQSGFHIPAGPGSVMPVYDDVFADIGDEQSIEQSLSTFSSHMKNIVHITGHAGSRSLVLLDELCAGTDPTEGAALAISILDELRKKGCSVIATTHYTELKKYAITTEGVENASMEFDVETLSPTYRLKTGVPGKSNAFEISEKLGLEPELITRARDLLEGGDIAFEEVIASLEEDKKRAEQERDEAIRLNVEIKRRKDELDARAAKFEERREREIQRAREQARDIIREAQETADEVKAELRELKRLEDQGERSVRFDSSRRRLREIEKKNRPSIKRETNADPVDPDVLEINDRVKILTLGQNGEIISLPDDKGNLQVQVGMMKIDVNIGDIMLIDGGAKKKKPSRGKGKTAGYGSMYREKTGNIKASVDVRGKNLDDAVMDVEKYIDDAFIAGLDEVTIIHGRGEGILKKGIRQALGRNRNVKSFERGGYYEGGEGVTVVKLK